VLYLPVTVALDRDIAVIMAARRSMLYELEWIETVECPGCWPRPGKFCIDLPARGIAQAGATPRFDLPRMYHEERRRRAARKIGFPR
jgi:hypothetical protein